MRIQHVNATVKTGSQVSLENITAEVLDLVRRTGVMEGLAVVTVPHTTCALAVNEDEQGLRQDIKRLAGTVLDPLEREAAFEHNCIDDNARAHLTSLLLGHAVNVPVSRGRLVLGTWQSIFLIEMDGPRSRQVSVSVLGE